jgi:hypothetical protein
MPHDLPGVKVGSANEPDTVPSTGDQATVLDRFVNRASRDAFDLGCLGCQQDLFVSGCFLLVPHDDVGSPVVCSAEPTLKKAVYLWKKRV